MNYFRAPCVQKSEGVVNLANLKAGSNYKTCSLMIFNIVQYFVLSLRTAGHLKPSGLLCQIERCHSQGVSKSPLEKLTHFKPEKFTERYPENSHQTFLLPRTTSHYKAKCSYDTLKIINAKIPLQAVKNLGHSGDTITSMLILRIPQDPGQRSTHYREGKHNFR